MRWLLNCVYCCLLIAALPLLIWKAWRHGKYREGWPEKLWGAVPKLSETRRPRIWFHAVSVGEVNLLPGVIHQVKTHSPESEIVVTTTTATGMQVAKRHFPEAVVCYCPMDFSWAVARAFRHIKPTAFILAELELWPNMIACANAHTIPVAVVNARLSDKSFRGYHRLRRLLRPMLRGLSLVAAQDQQTADRFTQLGVDRERIVVTGSVKFDGAPTERSDHQVKQFAELVRAIPNQRIWVAGSTIDPEEIVALEVYRKLIPAYPEMRLIIVPRHPERFDAVASMIKDYGFVCRRRSEIGLQTTEKRSESAWQANEIVLIDTIGELRYWWGLAQIAFVGGSMGNRGGQNMLEPAGYGATIAFGPDTRNFRDIANRLLDANAAVRVQDGEELLRFIREALDQPQLAAARGATAQQLVLSGRGATQRTIQALRAIISPSKHAHRSAA